MFKKTVSKEELQQALIVLREEITKELKNNDQELDKSLKKILEELELLKEKDSSNKKILLKVKVSIVAITLLFSTGIVKKLEADQIVNIITAIVKSIQ